MPIQLSLGSFYGIDTLFDSMIIVVALLISIQSRHIYGIVKENNFRYFSWAFLVIGMAYLFKVVSNLTVAYRVVIHEPNFVFVVLNQFEHAQLINFLSFTFYKILLVAGFLVLFLIMKKAHSRENILIFSYFSLVAILFSIYFNEIFRLTMIVILLSLAAYFHNNHKRIKSKNSLLVFMAFSLILLSNVLGLFYTYCPVCYWFDETLLFVGFALLLINHFTIKNDKKTNAAGSNKRYT